MPWGKYQGTRIEDLPDEYIDQLLSWRELKDERVKQLLKTERSRRMIDPRSVAGIMLALIKTGYKSMAVKYHPDHGGNTEQMQKLNAAKDALLEVVDRFTP
jgi:hypothetical protein